MNSKNNTNINWLNIISNEEFQKYLDLDLVKEVSMISKLTREKLNPLLFKYIILIPYCFDIKFNIKNNIFDEYFNHKYYGVVDYNVSSEVMHFSIDSGLKGLDLALSNIKQYAKSFNISDVKKAGYYLLPLVNIFCNLTKLKLESCIILYNEFFKLGESLPNLRQIELIRVTFIKLSTVSVPLDCFVLPRKLYYLSICHCAIANTDFMPYPCKFLFNYSIRFPRSNFIIPKIKAYSLKKLKFLSDSVQDSGLKEFLDINPNLESLKINSLYSNITYSLKSLQGLEINTVTDFDNDVHISTFDSVTMLKVGRTYMEYGDDNTDLKRFCLKFSNLKDLELDVYNYDELRTLSDKFLYKILSNLPKLKTLRLEIGKDIFASLNLFSDDESENDREDNINMEDIFDISSFNNIENLYLTANSNILFNTNFEDCKSLKQIKFCTSSDRVNTEEFLRKFKGYKNWYFKFTLHTIYGIKLSK
ncbi:hypothetical protein CONCODRAFT_11260 [Conidiobolus coronatus NRRL 28638]|uniref:RNI-like protein n=1 Tax=Conidiobolus coronatus (strain ATCC 28846 / CBS 209.66 / NRRL 28638) TaxID=796925 RepID=A0A137NVW4_CONC2|nr:hypothetical protein CONCODRAFT_11260 [Conidiobolus coronatus NRRL 28638]|eukprot:KXN66818.1 hypothetical protein CONCODRAFT_11260 [Conidiobolus coronatus NRRL 28638]